MNRYPRLLVLAHNSFSKQSSNGRTLGSLLQGWPKDRIAQFCISSNGADFNVCNNYYCVTDADVIHSIKSCRSVLRRDLNDGIEINANITNGYVKHYKTTLKMFLRNLAWMTNLWQGEQFDDWIADFAPEIILLQNGESFFMHRMATRLAKRYKSKLAIFNTEGYYLFKEDYFPADSFLGKQLFRLYRKIYRHYFTSFMRLCDGAVYGNKALEEDYNNVFHTSKTCTVYTGSELQFNPKRPDKSHPVFSYLGNMAYRRDKALIEFAEAIHRVNPAYMLDVYGPSVSQEMIDALNACTAIRYHGSISYDKVKEVIASSDFLVHVECQDNIFAESLKYGFSTKIADYISSGRIFILYSSPEIAGARYIRQNGAGIHIADTNQINDLLTRIFEKDFFCNIVSKSKIIAEENHSPSRNARFMLDFLKKINNTPYKN